MLMACASKLMNVIFLISEREENEGAAVRFIRDGVERMCPPDLGRG